MNRLELIRDAAIEKGFPELVMQKIPIQWRKIEGGGSFEATLEIDDFSIDVNPAMRKATDFVITGGLAHELGHIAKELGSSVLVRYLDGLLTEKCLPYQVWDERQADLLAIQRGFGEELLAYVDYANGHRTSPYESIEGPTAEEIKKILLK